MLYTIMAHTKKNENMIDMALTFTAMTRIFAKGSKRRIAKRFQKFGAMLKDVKSKREYENHHADFCNWFCKHIKMAPRKFKNRRAKESGSASYGQAAKVLDILGKIYVYYCSMPDTETARRIVPHLHGAIDTPIMKHLKRAFASIAIKASTIKAISREEYRTLQMLIARDIKEHYQNTILPVAYDDIMWNRLNR